MATYQMLWDCRQCGTPELLGVDHRFCPTCGAPQDPEARYFPSEQDKVAVEDHVFVGADRRCPACDTPNAAIAKHCVACGAPMEGAREVRRRGAQGVAAEDSVQQALGEHAQDKQAEEQIRIERQVHRLGAARPRSAPSLRAPLLVGLLLLGALLAAAVLCCGLTLYSTPTTVVATGHTWERTIAVEALMPVSAEAWRDQLPSDARGIHCRQEVRDTRQIPDGQDCHTVRVDNGDGTFSEQERCTPRYREEDIMGERCAYTVDRWKVLRTERALGGLAEAPAWPAARAAGGERLGARLESYQVSFEDEEGDTDWCSMPEDRWRQIAPGSRWAGERGLLGGLDCDSLEAR
jgi:hypothetical protein